MQLGLAESDLGAGSGTGKSKLVTNGRWGEVDHGTSICTVSETYGFVD